MLKSGKFGSSIEEKNEQLQRKPLSWASFLILRMNFTKGWPSGEIFLGLIFYDDERKMKMWPGRGGFRGICGKIASFLNLFAWNILGGLHQMDEELC